MNSNTYEEAVQGQDLLYRALKPRNWGLPIGAVFALLAAAMIIAYVITGNRPLPAPVFFDPTQDDTSYAYLDMQLLTECFAYTEEDGEIDESFYFVIDSNGNASIARLSDEQFDSFWEILEFTYSTDEDAPAPVRLKGIPRATDPDLLSLAIETFNEIWQEAYVTEDNVDEYLGGMYLDCTVDAIQEAQSQILACGILFLTLAVILLIGAIPKSLQWRRVVRSFPDVDAAGDVYAQFSQRTHQKFPKARCFITKDYLISVPDTLQILPLDDILQLQVCQTFENRRPQIAIAAQITDCDHPITITYLAASRSNNQLADKIVQALQAAAPAIQRKSSESLPGYLD